jgi:hypothetical protein
MSFRFAFPVLREHPDGREMPRAVVEHGFGPSRIVEEIAPVADKEREKWI